MESEASSPEIRRPYRMQRRAEHVDETKRRITEAAMRLHTSVGPSEASLSAIAAEAGVTRLTLHRHFDSAETLFAACMGHWRRLHPPPDPAPWREVSGFEKRVRRAVREMYAWYAANASDLYPIYRDAAFTPPSNQAARRATLDRIADALLFDDRGGRGAAAERRRAAILHAFAFWTWRSLSVDSGLSQDAAADLASRFIFSA